MNDLYGKIRSLDDLPAPQADALAREVVAFAASMIFETAHTVALTWSGPDDRWIVDAVLDPHGRRLVDEFSTEPEDTLEDIVDFVRTYLYRNSADESTLRIEVKR